MALSAPAFEVEIGFCSRGARLVDLPYPSFEDPAGARGPVRRPAGGDARWARDPAFGGRARPATNVLVTPHVASWLARRRFKFSYTSLRYVLDCVFQAIVDGISV